MNDQTKGPWTVGNPRKFHNQHYTPIEQPLMGKVMTEVCWVIDPGEVSLIAAAPELLNACELARNMIGRLTLVGNGDFGVMIALDKAIAKAEDK